MLLYQATAPAFCSCGSTAFTALVEADDDAGDGPHVLEGGDDAGGANVGPDSAAGINAEGYFECSQNGCEEVATHRYTWPGRPEQLACPDHARQAQGVASHMGWELHIVQLPTVVSDVAEMLRDPASYAYRKVDEIVSEARRGEPVDASPAESDAAGSGPASLIESDQEL